MFSTAISNFYNDTINWAFASKDKLHKIANNFNKDGSPITKDGATVYVSENEVFMDVPVTLTNFIYFLMVCSFVTMMATGHKILSHLLEQTLLMTCR
jgi:hypothetical protein